MPGGCRRKAPSPHWSSSAACCTGSSPRPYCCMARGAAPPSVRRGCARHWCCAPSDRKRVTTSATQPDIPVSMALPGPVIAVALIGDALIYVVLPLYHQEFGISLAMVGLLLSLNRWIRLLANSAVAHLGETIGPHALMIAAAAGSIVSTSLSGLAAGAELQTARASLWGISFS